MRFRTEYNGHYSCSTKTSSQVLSHPIYIFVSLQIPRCRHFDSQTHEEKERSLRLVKNAYYYAIPFHSIRSHPIPSNKDLDGHSRHYLIR